MILDTTYLLPLSRIEVDTDLLRAISERRITQELTFENIALSSISIFELQAKAAKLGVDPEHVSKAVSSIEENFRVEPFHSPDVIKTSFEIKKTLSDYIDCIIVATAASLKETLLSEDSMIIGKRKVLREKFGVNISTYDEMIRSG